MVKTNLPDRKVKRLFWDIEVTPNLVWTWRVGFKINISHDSIVKERKVICIAYKWEGEKKVTVLRWDKNQDDKAMLAKFSKVAEEADELVAQYGDGFDMPWFKTRFIIHNLPPLPVYKTIDTKAWASRNFYFNSNKLDYLGHILGVGRKLETKYQLWLDVIAGSQLALEYMCRYCIAPDQKLLGDDLIWKPAWDFKEGDTILGFDEHGVRRKYRKAKIEKFTYDEAEVFEVELSSGKRLRVTGDHKWLATNTRRPDGGAYGLGWIETKDMIPGKTSVPKLLDVWDTDKSNSSGWLAGIFDGEGCVSRRGQLVAMGQNPGPVLDKAVAELEARGFRLNVGGSCGRSCRRIAILGGAREGMRLVGSTRPVRLVGKFDFDRLGRIISGPHEIVISVKSIGKQTIAKITTSCATFVCEGYPMHNCGVDVLKLEKVYHRLAPYVRPKTHAGVLGGLDKWTCPRDGSRNVRKSKTIVSAAGTITHRMKCLTCGGYYTISGRAYRDYQEAKKKTHAKR